MVRDARRGALLTRTAALAAVAVLAVLPVVADMLDRHHVLVLGGIEHDDALRRAAGDADASTGQRINWPLSVTSMI